ESTAYGADGASQEQLPAYEEVHAHWFHKKTIAGKLQWTPFSLVDSMRLEDVHQMLLRGEAVPGFVATMGGRYDVSVEERTCSAVYWQETVAEVCRCTWFYRAEGETIFVPYDEAFSARLEAEYHAGATTGTWNRRLEFPSGDSVVMHNRDVIVHFAAAADAQLADEWGAVDRDLGVMRPRVVKRGVADVDEIVIDDGEAARIDHLVFVVHGIGSVCDLRFRDVIECTDGMRLHARSLVETHFCEAAAAGACGRVEYLPVQWHTSLHVGPAGVDRLLKAITLPSISKLRHYTNDTILDALFYTSPKYGQTIAEAVTHKLNRIFALFLARNPSFDRTRVSVAGHSLGSLIVFDILAHQGETPEEVGEGEVDSLAAVLQGMGLEEYGAIFEREQMDLNTLIMCDASDLKDLGVPMGPRKKLLIYIQEHAERKRKPAKKPLQQQQQQEKPDAGQQEKLEFGGSSLSTASAAYTMGQVAVAYPKLDFNLCAFFALGSPIAVFLTVRGVNEVCEDYRLPTCPGFFNIFHPFDPVAYRIEPMINKSFDLKPVLIPHHKGRKRMHLEIKENMARIGSDIKQQLMETFRSTWHTVAEFTRSHTLGQEQMDAVQKAVMDSAIEDMSKEQGVIELGKQTLWESFPYVLTLVL
ncbi:PREDICTED: SEC23-interacting protein-like, partial [Priapulus caudatus]|uniref:SEC23-interacting protein-like n=1 Tax=Priapulus caudatus TaxID=37621 RepID=A0ABM1E9C1_PRICU